MIDSSFSTSGSSKSECDKLARKLERYISAAATSRRHQRRLAEQIDHRINRPLQATSARGSYLRGNGDPLQSLSSGLERAIFAIVMLRVSFEELRL